MLVPYRRMFLRLGQLLIKKLDLLLIEKQIAPSTDASTVLLKSTGKMSSNTVFKKIIFNILKLNSRNNRKCKKINFIELPNLQPVEYNEQENQIHMVNQLIGWQSPKSHQMTTNTPDQQIAKQLLLSSTAFPDSCRLDRLSLQNVLKPPNSGCHVPIIIRMPGKSQLTLLFFWNIWYLFIDVF